MDVGQELQRNTDRGDDGRMNPVHARLAPIAGS